MQHKILLLTYFLLIGWTSISYSAPDNKQKKPVSTNFLQRILTVIQPQLQKVADPVVKEQEKKMYASLAASSKKIYIGTGILSTILLWALGAPYLWPQNKILSSLHYTIATSTCFTASMLTCLISFVVYWNAKNKNKPNNN